MVMISSEGGMFTDSLEKGKGERTMRSQVSHMHSVSHKQERAKKNTQETDSCTN